MYSYLVCQIAEVERLISKFVGRETPDGVQPAEFSQNKAKTIKQRTVRGVKISTCWNGWCDMKWFNGCKISLVLIGFMVSLMVDGEGRAKADFVIGTPTQLCGYPVGHSLNETFWVAQPLVDLDLNGDRKVDLADFCKLAKYWLQNEPSVDIAPVPFGDGIVDIQDVVVFAEYWLKDFRLVAHWKLDETEGSIAHDSVGNHDAFLLGPVWQPTGGKVNGALEFEGIGDLAWTNFVLNPADGTFSVFAWIKGGKPGEVIISQMDRDWFGTPWHWADLVNGRLVTSLMDPMDPNRLLVSDFVITDGTWHHIGLVWDGSRRHLYADGSEVATDTDDLLGISSSDGDLYFGAGKTFDAASFWSGLIDDVCIYDQALSAEEIGEMAQ